MKIIISTFAMALIATIAAANEQSPALQSSIHSDESGNFAGAVEMPAFTDEGEREAFLDNVCTGIENLLGGDVQCTCTPQILSGALLFDCDTRRDVTLRQRVIYTPSFNGMFAVAPLRLDVIVGTGYCLGRFSVQYDGLWLNLGDLCFSGQVKLDGNLGSSAPLVTPSLEECTFTAGEFGVCETCEPCTTPSGQTGFSVTCDFVEIASCVPLALPFGRNSRRVSPELFGEQIVEGMLELAEPEMDRLASEARAEEAAKADFFRSLPCR